MVRTYNEAGNLSSLAGDGIGVITNDMVKELRAIKNSQQSWSATKLSWCCKGITDNRSGIGVESIMDMVCCM